MGHCSQDELTRQILQKVHNLFVQRGRQYMVYFRQWASVKILQPGY